MKERIVIKVGSNLLVNVTNPEVFQRELIQHIFMTVKRLRVLGHEVVVVFSGAVAAGKIDASLQSRQAQAARGQWLMNAAISASVNDLSLSLMLVSREDICNRQRYITLQETFEDLLKSGVVPIVNENDATTIKDKNDFPDNDHLAAILAITLNAQRFFLLTNVDGVYDGEPTDAGTRLIAEIENVNLEFLKEVSSAASSFGRGGMRGKLRAARFATAGGIATTIMHGEQSERILDVLSGKSVGTFCKPRTHSDVQFSNRDRWLISANSSTGSIQVDEGAARAVKQRKSLLAVGVRKTYGTFSTKEAVEIIDQSKETIAVGLTDMSSKELTALIAEEGKPFNVEVVHADNLILI